EPIYPAGTRKLIKVAKRDTLYGLARRHNVTVRDIKKWNNLKLDRIRLGQTLEVFVQPRATAAKGRARNAQALKKTSRPAKVASSRTVSGKSKSGKQAFVPTSHK